MTTEKKKINFVEYNPKTITTPDTTVAKVSVDVKMGSLKIGKPAMDIMEMEGAFVKFYYEPTKKLIGWKVRKTVNQEEMSIWKLVQIPKSGVVVLGITGILKQFTPKFEKNMNKLVVQRYKDYSLMSDKEEIFYVNLIGN